jgi:hypothetical protein
MGQRSGARSLIVEGAGARPGRRSMIRRNWPGLGLALLLLSGCQTWFAGMTLPSPRYLQHPPQYIPPSPPFPLTRELAQQEAIAGAAAPGAGGGLPLPRPVPGGPPGPGGIIPPPP